MKRNKFSLSNSKLLSCDMGSLVPIGIQEVLPGDTFNHATSALLRVSPLLAPVMHPVHVRIHHWFVPFRLIWDDWEDFITGGPDGMNASVFPTRTFAGGTSVGGLSDYLGVPSGSTSITVSALPYRAYAMIWNEWYRDQDLQPEIGLQTTSGPDTLTNTTLQNCAWEKDYFTSARPWTQKGPQVSLPLGLTAPVIPNGDLVLKPKTSTQAGGNLYRDAQTGTTTTRYNQADATAPAADPLNYVSGLQTDLTTATAATVNQLREAMAIQRYEEARARYGSRYTEYLRYLGVKSSDARLQRPEYLGGGKQTIQFSEVLQTGVTTSGSDTVGVGNLKGHGIAAMRSNRYRRFFEEHGFVISLLSVRPKTIYASGLPRMFNRRTKEDFWQRELEHIGQQEILNKEVYAVHATPDGTFGYQDRYDEYRRQESSIAGEFRTTLNFWHYARIFSTPPALNADFVKSVPTTRTYAVPGSDPLWIMCHHSIQARRMLSKTGHSFIF